MGTDKRARQKANRAERQIQEAQAAKASAVKRNAVRWGVALIAAFAAVVLIAWLGGAFSDDDEGDLVTTDSVAASTLPAAVTTPGSTPATTAAASSVECPPVAGSAEQVREFPEAPPMCIDPAKTYTAEIVTNKGSLTVELDAAAAPQTVNNFVTLARYHYFDDTPCHRIIPGFMAQCGDPTGTGQGGPGYTIPDEYPAASAYVPGVVAMANTGQPNSGGSQFFIMTAESSLPPTYTIFGQVTAGLEDTVPALDAAGDPAAANGVPPKEEVTIESVTITEA